MCAIRIRTMWRCEIRSQLTLLIREDDFYVSFNRDEINDVMCEMFAYTSDDICFGEENIHLDEKICHHV